VGAQGRGFLLASVKIVRPQVCTILLPLLEIMRAHGRLVLRAPLENMRAEKAGLMSSYLEILSAQERSILPASLEMVRAQVHKFSCVPENCVCRGTSFLLACLKMVRAQGQIILVRPWKLGVHRD
jgi:hypothetical protein